jgi:ATP-dependent helicase/nuclease subunit A
MSAADAVTQAREPSLTDEQEQAVARRSGPLLLSAAAGSGKTSVLVERFVRAIREDGVAPAKILAITFTERAAGELRERVRARLLSLGEREAARDSEAASVGTFHGFCARLLRSHALLAGLDPDFAILDEGLAGRLREQAFRTALTEFLDGERSAAVDLIAAYGVDRVQRMIEDIHARLRSRGQLVPRLPPVAADTAPGQVDRDRSDAAAACALLDQLLAAFGGAYEALKAGRAAVDFDDLELRARVLLEQRESVRAVWSERFELLMVDEFQDTNPRQLAILRALEHENLFTVGDEFQSIYGFRHAEVALFRERHAELAEFGASLSLTSNFRSVAPLLEVVNAVFVARFADFKLLRAGREQPGESAPAAQLPLFAEATRPPQQPLTELLLTAKKGWEEDEALAQEIARGLPPAQLWRQAEARLLAQRVAELVRSGSVRAGDVAVLLRAGGDLEVYERALQLRGLRTLAGAGGFWAHQQIGDLLAYLRALANPLDEEALYGVLASPLVGVSYDALALLARAARGAPGGVWATLVAAPQEELLGELSEREREMLAAFASRLQSERASVSGRTLSELIERAVEHSGYREHVLALEWGERRLANIHKLLRLARRFEDSEGRDLRAFLDHAARLQETAGARESDAPVEGVEPDAVRLMSIHAAKGLEFPVVCVADLGRAANVRQPDLLVDGTRVGFALTRLDGAKATPALDYAELADERKRADAEEEDRILYVAMTRARERLLLSGAIEFDPWPRERVGGTMISWLAPALASELPQLAAAEKPATHDLAVGGARVRVHLNSAANAGEVLARGSMSTAPPPVPSYLRGGEEIARGREPLARQPAGVDGSVAAPAAMLSYTSLSELERCGYRYYLERVLGIGEERPPAQAAHAGVEARARGTLVHSLLETHDFRTSPPPSAGEVGERARELGIRVSAPERQQIAGLIAAALTTPLATRVAAAVNLRRELPFAFAPEGVGETGEQLISGVIDLLAEEAGGARLVIDYKSDRVEAGVDLAALVEREYGIQRLLYALAVLRAGAERVEIVHWFLERPHEPVGVSYTTAEHEQLEQRVAALLERARAQTFEVSTRPHRGLCLTCPGRTTLCSWGEAETLREDYDPGAAAAGMPTRG